MLILQIKNKFWCCNIHLYEAYIFQKFPALNLTVTSPWPDVPRGCKIQQTVQDKLHVCCSCIFDSLNCVYQKSYISIMWWACGNVEAVNSIAAAVNQVWLLGITGFPLEYSFSKFGVHFYVFTVFNLCSWNMCISSTIRNLLPEVRAFMASMLSLVVPTCLLWSTFLWLHAHD